MSNKIDLDKYYTPLDKAKYCIDKVYKIIGENNISEVIEPSAGSGSFSLQIPTTCWAYDIEPEDDRIVKQDYLELEMGYKKGRVVGFNFPFGKGNTLSVKFYKKSLNYVSCCLLKIARIHLLIPFQFA